MHTSLRLFLALLGIVCLPLASTAAPVRMIFDTDMQTDCDDAGALGVLHALADRGEVEILATIVCVLNPWAAPCTDALNTYYGRPHLPIGQLKGSSGVNLSSPFAQGVAQNFPHDTTAASAPDAVTLYRKILANEADQSVVILTLGYMTNLQNLLHSPADGISPLTGAQLIQQKVKTWICMGGNFPDDYLKTTVSDNVNFRRDPASVIDCVTNWPGRIEFVGREIGHAMRAGARLSQTPSTNPVRRAYELYFGGTAQDRHCADIVAVLYAARGLAYGAATYWGIQDTGSMSFTNTSAWFRWLSAPDLDQAYILAEMSPTIIQELLEDYMIEPPNGGQTRPTVAITAPAAGSRIDPGQTVTINATASDANGGIAKVEFFADWVKIGERVAPPYAIQWSNTQLGAHQLTAKATDNDSGTTIAAPVTIQIGDAPAFGNGLTGEYFDNADLTAPVLTRVDATVNFDWGTGSPHASIGADTFSVRWTGAVLPTHAAGTQSYTFYTSTNDGVRLWVNDVLLINDWVPGPLREKSGSIALEAKRLYSIRMEFFENSNTGAAALRWESADLAKQIVPQPQLFPQTNRTPVGVPDSANADQDLPVTVAVLANDSDADFAPVPLYIASTSGGAAGSAQAISGGAVIYTPPPGFTGTDVFSYTVSDGQASASANVTVTVQPWATFEPFLRRYFNEEERQNPEIAGWLADPDRDGWVNALEYSQFTDPRSPGAHPAAFTELRGGHLVLTFRRRIAATDHECVPEVSGTVGGWLSGADHIEERLLSDDGVQQIVEARDRTSASDARSRFIRFRVTALLE